MFPLATSQGKVKGFLPVRRREGASLASPPASKNLRKGGVRSGGRPGRPPRGEMWSRCIVCGKLKKDEELATITLYGRRAEACTMCAGEAGLSGPEHFSERPEIIEDLVKRWKKGRKKRCLTRLEALRDGLFPEQVREWATLAKTDIKSFRMSLSGLPFLADKLSILMDACGLNGFDACAVLFRVAEGSRQSRYHVWGKNR